MASIFVGKLDFNATEEQLKSIFEEYGRVSRVSIGKDRETGKPKGFAFVEMADEGEARNAVENLNETSINGRAMAVSIAEQRAGGSNSAPRSPRPAQGNFTPRENRTDNYKSDYNKTDDKSKGPVVSADDLPNLVKKVEKPKEKSFDRIPEAPKKKKMETYKKSGKNNRFFEDDDEDDLDYRKRDTGWDDDDDE